MRQVGAGGRLETCPCATLGVSAGAGVGVAGWCGCACLPHAAMRWGGTRHAKEKQTQTQTPTQMQTWMKTQCWMIAAPGRVVLVVVLALTLALTLKLLPQVLGQQHYQAHPCLQNQPLHCPRDPCLTPVVVVECCQHCLGVRLATTWEC